MKATHPHLNWPEAELRMKEDEGRTLVFDEFRKKWVVCSPEEYVRQLVAHFLKNYRGFPAGLIAVEKQLKLNDLVKRWDVLCYNKNGRPLLLVECKEPGVGISKNTFHQAMRYNLEIHAPFLLVTNGLKTYVLRWTGSSYEPQEHIPDFKSISE